jgi:ATP-binding cassette, subfamily C (CFTR/MRP), member 1
VVARVGPCPDAAIDLTLLDPTETKTRSPIFTHFGEALRGTDIIRSIPGAMQTWSQRHRSLSDENLKVYYSVKALDRWLSTRLETLGNSVVFAVAIASVFMTRSGGIKAGFAGWALTQSLAITGLLTWAVRCLTDLETNMMSLQRVRELTDLESEEVDLRAMKPSKSMMPKELSQPGEALQPLLASNSFNATLAPLVSTSLKDDGWPWYGNVRFFNVSMRYSPGSPLVLNGVTLQVPAGTTLGVVGTFLSLSGTLCLYRTSSRRLRLVYAGFYKGGLVPGSLRFC